jgi:hypothetical protein
MYLATATWTANPSTPSHIRLIDTLLPHMGNCPRTSSASVRRSSIMVPWQHPCAQHPLEASRWTLPRSSGVLPAASLTTRSVFWGGARRRMVQSIGSAPIAGDHCGTIVASSRCCGGIIPATSSRTWSGLCPKSEMPLEPPLSLSLSLSVIVKFLAVDTEVAECSAKILFKTLLLK